jgi:ribosomal protein L40E
LTENAAENAEDIPKKRKYCPECGAENEEEASFCTKCGFVLKEGVAPIRYRRRSEKDEKHEKTEISEKDEKSEKDERAEKGEESQIWIALVGMIIILAGFISLIDSWYGYGWASWDRLWPIIPIIFGLFIIWNGLKARERSPRP